MSKETIEARVQHFLSIRCADKDSINAMLDMRLVAYDIEKQSVTLTFPVQKWELNPAGNMHGGMICAALDVTMGCASYIYSKADFTPTIQMSVNFVKGIKEQETLLIEGICDHAGSRMAQARSIATLQSSGEVAATGNGSYAINTKK